MRRTLIVPGYWIRGRVAIYGGGHHSKGQKVWLEYCRLLSGALIARTEIPHLWVEFGPSYGVEYWEDDTLVEVR